MTPFSSKVDILCEFYMEFIGVENFAKVFVENDLALPLAVAAANGYATITDSGAILIEETWQAICEAFRVDYHGDYSSLYSITDMALEDE